MTEPSEYVLKVRKPGRRAMLLSDGGRTTRLRVHAVRFATRERAEAAAVELGKLNPTLKFEVAA
jgi:hypothetical protein